jgi:hypothetical protein
LARQVPWPRIFAEGVAIVVSILLAFAIQAWWERRQLEATRVELLSTLLESVRLDRETLARNIQGSERTQAMAGRFYSLAASSLTSVQRDTAATYIYGIQQPNTVQFSNGPLSSALDASRLGLIEDTRVLSAINRWSGQVSELDERANTMIPSAQAVLRALAAHEIYQQWQFLSPSTEGSVPGLRRFSNLGLPERVDLSSLRDDPELMAAAAALAGNRRVYLRFAEELGGTLETLEELLSSMINEAH